MPHQYDATLSSERRKAQMAIYYNSLRPAMANFDDLKERNECPKRDVNEFKVVSKLGSGTYGSAYRAVSNSVLYVIKKLEKNYIREEGMIQHSINEKVFTYAMQESSFIIQLHASFKDKENLYLIMECAEYGDLTALQELYDYAVPESLVRQVIAQIVLGLQYMHACGVMNRDLKGDNILMCKGGRVKLADLGLAFEFFKEPRVGYGALYFKAPEMFSSNAYNEAVDWWALGVITYDLLCGEHPFCEPNDFKDPAVIYELITGHAVKFARPSVASTSEEFKDIVSRLLEANPSRRIGIEKEGSIAVQNHEWFKALDWYEVLFNPSQLDIDYIKLEENVHEEPVDSEYPFKENLPDAEDPLHEQFKDF